MTATAFNSLDIAVSELDSLDALGIDWDDFSRGVSVGIAIVGLVIT